MCQNFLRRVWFRRGKWAVPAVVLSADKLRLRVLVLLEGVAVERSCRAHDVVDANPSYWTPDSITKWPVSEMLQASPDHSNDPANINIYRGDPNEEVALWLKEEVKKG